MRYINFNGKILNDEEAFLHVKNRAFRYGDGLFETIVISGDNIPFLDFHFERLKHGLAVLSIKPPSGFSKSFLNRVILELVSKNAGGKNWSARVTVFRGGLGKYKPDSNSASYLIEVEPLKGTLFALNKTGLKLGLFDQERKSIGAASTFKSCSALLYVMAALDCKKKKVDDNIILNSKGNACEATSSNLFVIKKNLITTPPLSEGCVDGVMRKQILLLARKNNFKIREQKLTVGDLKRSDEIFLTNAVAGIRWVNRFEEKRYANPVSSTLSQILQNSVTIS